MKIKLSLLNLCLLLQILTPVVWADENQSTPNLGVIDSLLLSCVRDHLQRAATQADTVQLSVSGQPDMVRQYLISRLSRAALGESLAVYRNNRENTAFQGIVFEINEFRPEIDYTRPYGNVFFAENRIGRNIKTAILGQFYDKRSGRILWLVDEIAEYSDTVSYGSLRQLEQSPYVFTSGQRKDFSTWEKLLEPVLIISSVAVIVYLFFSQRS